MSEEEKIVMAGAMSGERDEGVISAYLSLAGSKILRRAYPFAATATEVPEQYAFTQVEIAVYLLNKRGADGETSHTENGISRSYEDADVPYSLMRQIVPMVGVL